MMMMMMMIMMMMIDNDSDPATVWANSHHEILDDSW